MTSCHPTEEVPSARTGGALPNVGYKQEMSLFNMMLSSHRFANIPSTILTHAQRRAPRQDYDVQSETRGSRSCHPQTHHTGVAARFPPSSSCATILAILEAASQLVDDDDDDIEDEKEKIED
jgi:hypothetical protein